MRICSSSKLFWIYHSICRKIINRKTDNCGRTKIIWNTQLIFDVSQEPENPSLRGILKVVLYAYMNGDFSSRVIQEDCRLDINFMYLPEGSPVPDHAAFARFHTLHFAPCAKKTMVAVTKFLYSIGKISGKDIFIDGTKIEVYANKYTFVWKKAATKNLEKLLGKLAMFAEACEEMYGLKIMYQDKVTVKHMKKLRKKLYKLKKDEGIEFVHGEYFTLRVPLAHF